MKILMRVLAGLVVLVVAVVVAGVAIVMTIDPNEYRGKITAAVKEATGRDLVIKGDLKVGISLIPTLVATDVSFANAPWGSRPEMVSLKRLETALEVLPLLKGEIRVGKLVLIEPDILLEVASDGRANWDFNATGSVPKSAAKSDAKPASGGGAPVVPSIGSLDIEKAKFRYHDAKTKQDLALALDKMTLGGVGSGNKLKLDIAGNYNGAAFTVKGTTDPIERAVEDDDYGLDLEANAFAADAKVKGTLIKPMSAPGLGLDFSLAGKDLTQTLAALKTIVPTLDTSSVPNLGGYQVSGKASGAAAAPTLANLSFNVGTTDAFKLTGTGKGSGNTYTIDKFNLDIKGSDLAGNVTAAIGGKVPDIKANLTSHKLDVADIESLLPQDKSTSDGASAPAAKGAQPRGDGRVFPPDPLPLQGLKAVNATVAFKGDRIVVNGTPIDLVSANLVLAGGKLTLDPFSATVAEGKVGGKTTLDATNPAAVLHTALTVDKLNIGKMLKDRDITDMLTGHVSTKADVQGTGNSVRALMAGLNGSTEVTMQDGTVNSKYVNLIAADLTKALIPSGKSDTKINCLVSRFEIKQGMATSKGLLFDTDQITVSGGGTVDLRDEKLNLAINPEPKQNSLISLATPLEITGTLANPIVRPATAALIKNIAGLAIGGLTPVGLVASFAKMGSSDQNPCVAALDAKEAQQPQQKSGPMDTVTKPLENLGNSIKGLFGGTKK